MLEIIHTCQRSTDIALKTDQIIRLSKREYRCKLEVVYYVNNNLSFN